MHIPEPFSFGHILDLVTDFGIRKQEIFRPWLAVHREGSASVVFDDVETGSMEERGDVVDPAVVCGKLYDS